MDKLIDEEKAEQDIPFDSPQVSKYPSIPSSTVNQSLSA
jgi:hypothetical protein